MTDKDIEKLIKDFLAFRKISEKIREGFPVSEETKTDRFLRDIKTLMEAFNREMKSFSDGGEKIRKK